MPKLLDVRDLYYKRISEFFFSFCILMTRRQTGYWICINKMYRQHSFLWDKFRHLVINICSPLNTKMNGFVKVKKRLKDKRWCREYFSP